MDFPVEATVHLNIFANKSKVLQILQAHGFELTILSRDQVLVKGSFLKLKGAKASLDSLLNSQAKRDISPSSGAISKHNNNDISGGAGSRLAAQKYSSPFSPGIPSPSWGFGSSNNHPTSPEIRTSSFIPSPDRQASIRLMGESFVVDADVFSYAARFRKKEMDGILDSHNVRMERCEVGDSVNVTLVGKSARTALGKVQSLLNELSKSLRTQEVPLKDVHGAGQTLLAEIRRNRDIHGSVLVCPKNYRLHLVGPSGESYELKQRLLGRPLDQPGRSGRTSDRNSQKRSKSLPPMPRKNTDRDRGGGGGATAAPAVYPVPNRAQVYSPSKYQDTRRGRIETQIFVQRERNPVQKGPNGHEQDTENKRTPHKTPKNVFQPLLQKLKKINKR